MTGTLLRRSRAVALVAGCLAGALVAPAPAGGAVVPTAAVVRATEAPATGPAQPFDLDGDGFADLVSGVPGESIGRVSGAGALSVLYGGPDGVTSAGDRLIHQGTRGVIGGNERDDHFGSGLASADFDRDGYADLAIGAPGEGGPDTGAVTVLYGGPDGVTGAGDARFSPKGLAVTGRIGPWLAAGDINGDGYADLVVGAQPVRGHPHGTVVVLYGSGRGLRVVGATHLTDAAAGGSRATARVDFFGASLALGDVTGDGVADLAVGSRRDGVGGLYLFRGRSTGIAPVADQYLSQDAPDLALPDTAYAFLGDHLAIGDFDGDGHGDLAAGDDDAGPPGFSDCQQHASCPGAVLVLPGTAAGLDTSRKQLWWEDSPGVPGTAGGADGFGSSLAAGDLDADGHDDLAVGVPGSTTAAPVYSAGAVNILYGSSDGLSASRAQRWTQNSPGIPGSEEPSDFFGSGVRITQVGRSRPADLVVWAAGEDIQTVEDAGSLTVLYGATDLGVQAPDSRAWSQNAPGVSGSAEPFDTFGLLQG